jgi:hypothetical protein
MEYIIDQLSNKIRGRWVTVCSLTLDMTSESQNSGKWVTVCSLTLDMTSDSEKKKHPIFGEVGDCLFSHP